jgi:hypothetical protein
MSLPGLVFGRIDQWIQEHPREGELVAWALKQASVPDYPDQGYMERILHRLLPANWMDISIGLQAQARKAVATGEICLAWVPRGELIGDLALAARKAERDEALLRHEDALLEDVTAVLEAVIHERLVKLRHEAQEATVTFLDGHPRPAQSFCASLIGEIVEDVFGYENFASASEAFDLEPPDEIDFRDYRRGLIQWMIKEALRGRDTGPRPGFNRHLTAHSVNPQQYTRANAIGALMLVAGTLRELQEIYTLVDRRLQPWPSSFATPPVS